MVWAVQRPDAWNGGVPITGLVPATDKVLMARSNAMVETALSTLIASVLADAGLVASLAGKQPLDADLTSIAALTTTAYGRSVLEAANAAALRTLAGVVVGTDVEAHDTDLTTIAGLTPANDDLLQRKAGAWTNRTIEQVARDMGTWRTIAKNGAALAAHTGTLAETTLITITIPGGSRGPNGAARVTTVWSYTNSANTKTARTRHAGTAFTALQLTTTATVRMQAIISNRNSQSSQVGAAAAAATFTAGSGARITGTADTSANQDITITAELANTGESMTLEEYHVETLYWP